MRGAALGSLAVRIEAVERALLELAKRLDAPFMPRGDPDSVAMALGHRVRTLYRGYLTCTEAGLPPAAGRALLRPMVEANILLRFIREEPEWRSRLWQAESTRVWLGLAEQARSRPLPAEQQLGLLPTPEEVREIRGQLEELRRAAIAAGIEGVHKKGRLLPDAQEQAQILDTVQVWQAYVVAYMPLTLEQHVAHGSFRDALEHQLDDGWVVHRETTAEQPLYAERLLASSVFASTLVIVSSWLGLGFEEAADRLREEVVAARGADGDKSVGPE